MKDESGAAFVELHSTKLTVRVNRASGAVSYLDPSGQLLLTEDSTQPRSFEKTEVIKSVPDPA